MENLIKKYKVWRHFKTLKKGVIEDPRPLEEKQRDYVGIGADQEVLCPDGQWDAYKPTYETQFIKYADTYACVSYSACNTIEFLYKRKYGIEINLSDRFLAILSGTKCYLGNWLQKVADTLRHNGFLYENEFPAPAEIRKCEDFYIPLTEDQINLAKSRLNEYEITYRWIPATEEDIKNALRYAPLQVIIENGIHAVTCYGYVGNKAKIYDHYLFYGDNCYLYDFSKIKGAMQYDIKRKKPLEIRVDNKYGNTTDDWDLFKVLPVESWVYLLKKRGEFPSKRQFYGLTVGRWDYDTVFNNKRGDLWLYFTKSEAKEKGLI